jgi:hypothetical protein
LPGAAEAILEIGGGLEIGIAVVEVAFVDGEFCRRMACSWALA